MPTSASTSTSASSGCTDSDGGKNYYVKGTTCLGDRCKTDGCLDNTKIIEYYCSWGNMVSRTSICASKCQDGACISSMSVAPVFSMPTLTPTRIRIPTLTPTPMPTLTPTRIRIPTLTPTRVQMPTLTPTPIQIPTLTPPSIRIPTF
jgi:hypothetical protein